MVEKIRELCKMGGISINKLEKECGLGRGTVSRWDKNVPSADKVVRVANYFNVPVSELTGDGQKEKPALTVEDGRVAEVMALFSQLPDEEQRRELAYLRERVNELNK